MSVNVPRASGVLRLAPADLPYGDCILETDDDYYWRVSPELEVDTRPWDCYDIETWNGEVVAASLTFASAREIVERHNATVDAADLRR